MGWIVAGILAILLIAGIWYLRDMLAGMFKNI